MSNSIKDGSYINIQSFMVTELELKGNELLVYAIIYGFSQTNGTYFSGSTQYLADWTNSTRQGIMKNLKSLIDKGLIEKVGENQQVNYYKALRPVNKVNQSTELTRKQSLQGAKQSLQEEVTEFTGTCKQSLHSNIYNKLDNNINNNSSSVDESTQPQHLEEKAIEFRNDIIELKDIIINSTGENPQTVDMVFKPVMYRDIIKPLLAKIKASKFLMGEKDIKPKLYTFVRQDRINEILAGLYDDFEKKKTVEVIPVENLKDKARREKEQEEFERMLGL
ncbi:helix-turn-helix domain-containing protein [Fusobacterium mortiferum]|uniref:Helix-turn-helix domain-containing protein n=1 Tax=Fusobacterium mortiferum ATCC 9817 TaxID=469616 RepID=A0ABM6TXR4_FUSMR|nr:helix-turn-helix domain-containing protein [Fusobacterium mortiferum]AVQ19215.1 helix-turn-helix domain-containing protein [Fusobacterium mortiferum ATCC 9817]EEO36385.1 hypothetical protein FMAG_01947 [Fusobacterium mortiferum ATCC 9817]